eukprot:353381-Chlamydomonas_euryale.AAC.1
MHFLYGIHSCVPVLDRKAVWSNSVDRPRRLWRMLGPPRVRLEVGHRVWICYPHLLHVVPALSESVSPANNDKDGDNNHSCWGNTCSRKSKTAMQTTTTAKQLGALPAFPATKSTAFPATKSTAFSATKSTACPATKSSAFPSTKSSACPATGSSARPATGTSARPATGSSAFPATKSTACPATKTSVRPAT